MVCCGFYHSLALKSDWSVWVTGRNNNGQLGIEDYNDRKQLIKVLTNGVKAIACGLYHSFVLKNDGSVWATRDNFYGQLGTKDTYDRNQWT